jgi:hypothetical protein
VPGYGLSGRRACKSFIWHDQAVASAYRLVRMSKSQTDYIASILLEASKYGGTGISLTMLLKFLYLLDLYSAEALEGQPCTGFRWRFHHFGPYSEEAVVAINVLVAEGPIARHERESADRDLALLQWRPDWRAPNLDALDLPGYAKLRLMADIKKFRFDLPGLLNYVYFHTTPMESAYPGVELTFRSCRKLQSKDVKPIALNAPSKAAADRARALLNEMVKRLASEHTASLGPPAILDRHYLETASPSDGKPVQGEINATLTFPKHR